MNRHHPIRRVRHGRGPSENIIRGRTSNLGAPSRIPEKRGRDCGIEPLGRILVFSQLARKSEGLPEQAAKDLDRIQSSAMLAREIVRKLLPFVRQDPPRMTRADPSALAAECLRLLEPYPHRGRLSGNRRNPLQEPRAPLRSPVGRRRGRAPEIARGGRNPPPGAAGGGDPGGQPRNIPHHGTPT